jgi:hypothetical protein
MAPAVASYRCYFLDFTNRVAATQAIQCRDDSEAQTRADQLLAESIHAGIEVWDFDRKVYWTDKLASRRMLPERGSTDDVITESDILRAAKAMIKNRGVYAARHASLRADDLRQMRSSAAEAIWRRIVKAIERLQAP